MRLKQLIHYTNLLPNTQCNSIHINGETHSFFFSITSHTLNTVDDDRQKSTANQLDPRAAMRDTTDFIPIRYNLSLARISDQIRIAKGIINQE